MLRPPRSAQEFSEEVLPTPLWLIEDLLPGDGWTILYAQAKTGKSLLAMQLAADMSLGRNFLGHPLRRGKVLYVQLDAPTGNWQGQVRRMPREEREPWDTWTRDDGIPFYLLDSAHTMKRRELREIILARKYQLVIWDALEKLTRGNLNETATAQSAMDALRGMSPGVNLVIHHPRKTQGEVTDDETDSISGSHYLSADPSGLWKLSHKNLVVKTRLGEKKTIKLERTPAGLWRVASGAPPKPKPDLAKPIAWGEKL